MPTTASSPRPVRRAFKQLALDPWPAGLHRAAALLRFEPWELARRCGVTFARSHDDLDFTDSAIAQPIGRKAAFALVRHLGCPEPGTELWIHEDVKNADSGVTAALRCLGLSPRHLVWVRE